MPSPFIVALYLASAVLAVNGGPSQATGSDAVGSPPVKGANQAECPHLKRLEVLPGRGRDNLRNRDMGAVSAFTYKQCKTTEDGEYLLPDNIFTIPVKESKLQLSSEMFEHWLNYTSLTSSSFRVHAGGTIYGKVSIEGSFSADFENCKRRQVNDKSITTRVSSRNTIYIVGIEPSFELNPQLRNIFSIALTALQNNNTEKVDTLMEFIVKDYGTHYTTRMDAGAILTKEDFVTTKFLQDNWASKSSINAAASASYLGLFDFGMSTQNSVTEEFLKQYKSSVTSSSVDAIGGGPFKFNMSVNEWINSIPNNLVAVDRSGEPLHYIITPTTFPDVPLKLLARLRNELAQSIQQYYAYNTHKGCLSRDSPNFDFLANVDDGSCKSPANNYSFGGVFQKCQTIYNTAGDLCTKFNLNQNNPLTSTSSCPQNFIPILLNSGSKVNSYTVTQYGQSCSGHWFWRHCETVSWPENHYSESHYQTYWCVANVFPVPPNTGLLFGGVFTSFLNNPLTQAKSCPPFFYPLRMGSDLQVCVSDDYQMGFQNSAELGGFFSCSQGNPLLLNRTTNRPIGGYPRGCPDGHTQHMAAIDNDCEINYCVPANVFPNGGQIPIVLPPFRDPAALFQNATLALTMSEASDITNQENVSSGGIAGIVISCLVLAISLAVGLLIWRRRRRNAASINSGYGPIDENAPLINGEATANNPLPQETARPV